MKNTMLIAATEAQQAAEKHVDLPDKVRAAFAETKHHWLVSDANERIQAALAGVLLNVADNEQMRVRLEYEIAVFQAITSAETFDFTALVIPENYQPIGLAKLWQEA